MEEISWIVLRQLLPQCRIHYEKKLGINARSDLEMQRHFKQWRSAKPAVEVKKMDSEDWKAGLP